MPTAFLADFLRRWRRERHAAGTRDDSDAALLTRFVAYRDEAAFETLVQRHGPMVLHVCRQLLHDSQEAEDAFQSTFLVLVQKAATIGRRELLANWLYGVAYRVAARARAKAVRRYQREMRGVEMTAAQPTDSHDLQDLLPVLHEEMDRLPEKFRAPLVLCYLEGKTREEAARQLGWTEGAVKGSLERGRDLLRSRLVRRGVTVSAALLATILTPTTATATVPPALVQATVHGAVAAAAGKYAAGASVGVPLLKIGGSLLVIVSVIGGGICLLLRPLDGKSDSANTKYDISMLGQAISVWQVKFGVKDPFPSRIKLCKQYSDYDLTKPLDRDSVAFLTQVWPKLASINGWTSGRTIVNWDGTNAASGTWNLEGQECLVFFLGGIPATNGGVNSCAGFSTNPANPAYHFTNPSSTIIPPFFSFDSNRLKIGQSGQFFHYLDAYEKRPYAYFSSYKTANGYNRYAPTDGSDCSKLGVWPYAEAPNRYLNPNTFQIISAGADGVFGEGSRDPLQGPFFHTGSRWYRRGQSGYDDVTNFDPQQFGGD